MKTRWDTPVLSVMRRATSAEKVLFTCKSGGPAITGPGVQWAVACFRKQYSFPDVCEVCYSCQSS